MLRVSMCMAVAGSMDSLVVVFMVALTHEGRVLDTCSGASSEMRLQQAGFQFNGETKVCVHSSGNSAF